MGGLKGWMGRLTCAAILAAAFGGAVAAQDQLLLKSVEYSMRYQQAGSLLAMTTRCGRLPEYQGYDKDRATIDYQNARNFLEGTEVGSAPEHPQIPHRNVASIGLVFIMCKPQDP